NESEISNFLLIINKIRDVSKDYCAVNIELNKVNQEIEKLSSDEDLKKEISFDVDYDYLIKELNDKRNHYNLLKDETLRDKNNLIRYEEQLSQFNDLESEKDELEENLAIYNEKYEILSKTMEFLEKSNENLKVKYRKPLEEALNKYLRYIVKDKEIKAKIDTDLNIFIEENGVLTEAEYYSKGFQDLFRICKSFALSAVLFTVEKPFIVLDDVFTNLDDKKLIEAIKSIKELSNEYQILYFVCHESRRA
ncbi:MAG: hypothetical protein KBS91_01620, partial [Firmicutes bacterium]|nr:hypothetical protein [Candidatus Caballimonas caccae]